MVHAHAWHMRHVSARGHLARKVSTGSREAGYGTGGRAGARPNSVAIELLRRAATAASIGPPVRVGVVGLA